VCVSAAVIAIASTETRNLSATKNDVIAAAAVSLSARAWCVVLCVHEFVCVMCAENFCACGCVRS
jgi:hypothetical protein